MSQDNALSARSTSQPARKSTRLFLLDPENLAAKPFLTGEDIMTMCARVSAARPIRPADIVLIGASPLNAYPCRLMSRITHGNVFLRSGKDGAERALAARLKEIPHSQFGQGPRMISECIIGSGDHFFTDTARQLKVLGVTVTVISQHQCLSTRLAQVADHVRLITHPPKSHTALAA